MLKLSDIDVHSYYWRKKVERNLRSAIESATNKQIQQGLQWYPYANKIARKMADRYGYSVETVVHVISALSPRNKWKQNLKDTATVLNAVNHGICPDNVKVCTFHKNKYKAFDIAKGNQKIESEALKTYAFVQNIAHLDNSYITVDVWHLRACYGETCTNLIDSRYKLIQQITIELAKEYGFNAIDFQAIVWVVTRNNWK